MGTRAIYLTTHPQPNTFMIEDRFTKRLPNGNIKKVTYAKAFNRPMMLFCAPNFKAKSVIMDPETKTKEKEFRKL